jgi:hypothetical protein
MKWKICISLITLSFLIQVILHIPHDPRTPKEIQDVNNLLEARAIADNDIKTLNISEIHPEFGPRYIQETADVITAENELKAENVKIPAETQTSTQNPSSTTFYQHVNEENDEVKNRAKKDAEEAAASPAPRATLISTPAPTPESEAEKEFDAKLHKKTQKVHVL